MPLERQTTSFPLARGLDSKTDPKHVPAGELLTVENATFISPGRLKKRNGFNLLSRVISNPTDQAAPNIISAQMLASYASELLLADNTSLYSYDSGAPAWTYKSPLVSCSTSISSVITDTNKQTQADGSTHASGIQAYAWEDSSGGLRYTVIDSATGQIVVPSKALAASGIKPKVLAIGSVLAIYYYDTTTTKLHVATVPVATPTATPTTSALTSALTDANSIKPATPNYDATVITTIAGPQVYLAFNNQVPGTSIWRFAQTDLVNPAQKATALTDASAALAIFGDPAQKGPVLVYSTGTALKFYAWDYTLGSVLGSDLIETNSGVSLIAGIGTSASTTTLRVFWTVTAPSTWNYTTRTCLITAGWRISALAFSLGLLHSDNYRVVGGSATRIDGAAFVAGMLSHTGSASGPVSLLRSAALAGKPFFYNSAVYVPLVYESPLQPTYFISDASGNVVARLLGSLAGGIPTRVGNGSSMLPEVTAASDGSTFRIALLRKNLLTTQSGQVYTLTGVVRASVAFVAAANYLRAELGRNLHISGGMLQMYDGAGVVEHGFHLYPEPVVVTNLGTSASASAYQYVVCYEWTDAQGQIHRSAPSIAVTSYQTTAIGATNTVSVTIPTLRITAKQTRASVNCVVYRTIANGTVFYQVTSVTAPVANYMTSDTVSFTDAITDAALLGNPLLYTTGGVLENVPPDGSGAVAIYRNRLVLVDSESPLRLWYSKQVVPGAPVEFNDALTLNIDPRGGDATAVANLDDKLIVFKGSSIFYVTGQGPDAAGLQNDFSDSQIVTTDCGCVNPRSIVTTPQGLMFQSAKGIYLLSRDLSVSYAGADVERYNPPEVVTSAQLIPTTNQVRFTLASGIALVFDYLVGQWGVFTPIAAADSTIFQSVFTYLRADGAVMQESPGRFDDAGSFVKLKIVTGWLKFAGLQGFQRVFKVLVLGEYASPHSLLVQVAYDFDSTFVQQDTVTPAAPGAFGSDATFGSGDPFGGAFPLYQWRLYPQRQRCQAIMLGIEDVQSGTGVGEAMSLSALSFEIGVEPGLWKVPAGNSAG